MYPIEMNCRAASNAKRVTVNKFNVSPLPQPFACSVPWKSLLKPQELERRPLRKTSPNQSLSLVLWL
jgi:hypothetical protein